MLRSFLRVLWKRDSESVACLCIELADRMNDKDLWNIADYFRAVHESRTPTPAAGGRR